VVAWLTLRWMHFKWCPHCQTCHRFLLCLSWTNVSFCVSPF
jgi:hypothetical protein